MAQPSDEQLVERFRDSGDIGQFDELVRRHVGPVRRVLFSMVLNHADADDLTQEVFLRVARGIGDFRGRATFSTWLYRITVNAARSFLARAGARRAAQIEVPDDIPDPVPGPDRNAELSELDARVGAAMGRLPAPLRAAITLTAIEGLDGREAARAAGCLPATLYWRVHQARKILRREMEERWA